MIAVKLYKMINLTDGWVGQKEFFSNLWRQFKKFGGSRENSYEWRERRGGGGRNILKVWVVRCGCENRVWTPERASYNRSRVQTR